MKLIFEHNIQEIPCNLIELLDGCYHHSFDPRPPGGILNFTRINFRKFVRNEQEPNKFMLVDDNKEIKYCVVTRIDRFLRNVYFEVSPVIGVRSNNEPRSYTEWGTTRINVYRTD
jgi:hypothetical protein